MVSALFFRKITALATGSLETLNKVGSWPFGSVLVVFMPVPVVFPEEALSPGAVPKGEPLFVVTDVVGLEILKKNKNQTAIPTTITPKKIKIIFFIQLSVHFLRLSWYSTEC